MEVTRELAREVTAELKETVEALFKKHGLTPPKTHTSYGQYYKVSFEASLETLDEKTGINLTSKEAIAYQQLHAVYGLPDGLLGTVFTTTTQKGQDDFVFSGIASSRSKYPLAAKSLNDDRTYFFPRNYVAIIMKAAGL